MKIDNGTTASLQHRLTMKGSLRWVFGMREFTLVLMIALMFVIIPIFQPKFATQANVITTLLSVATKGIVGIGVTYILVSGALDLSVGGVVALICAVFGAVYHGTGSLAFALACSFTIGVLCGAINGILVTRFRLSAFIATLAMMGIARGITYVLTKGTPIKLTDIPEGYKVLGTGTVASFPYVVIMFIVLAVLAHFMLKKSRVLRQNVYTGSNEKAARYSGVNTKKIIVMTFVLIGILCWVAAQMSVARFLTASPSYGLSWETELIAAAVIGGATLDGGEGSVIGTSLGLILLGFVSSAMLQLGVSVYWQNFVGSFILLVAVLFDAAVESRKRKAQ
jgi:ribose transport system permease protein